MACATTESRTLGMAHEIQLLMEGAGGRRGKFQRALCGQGGTKGDVPLYFSKYATVNGG